jgi:predicted outer membrane repeat protein
MTRSKALVVSLVLGLALTLVVLTQVQEIEASAPSYSGDASAPVTDPRLPRAPDDVTGGEIAQLYANAPDRCFAEITGDGVTDFASNDAGAVQDALENRGALSLSESAVSGNTASADGGGIYTWGTLTVTGSTIAGNVTLDGTGSDDPDLDPLDYGWTQTGDPAVALAGPTTATPTFTPTFTSTTSLTFTLVVTDLQGVASSPDTAVVTVNPRLIYLPFVMR